MKKFLSCVLALALVFSLMSMTVIAGNAKLPVDGKKGNYDVIGTQGDKKDTQTSYQDGVTDFDDTDVSSKVDISFGTPTTTDPNTGAIIEGTNVLEHRYAIDIIYKDLIIDLTDLNTQETTDGTTTTTTKEYKFVWDVNDHTYVMVEVVDGAMGNEVAPTDPALVNTAITIDSAFQIVNHSDLSVSYSAKISTDAKYANYLRLGIDGAFDGNNNANALATKTVNACQAKETPGVDGAPSTWTPATEVTGDAHTIYATPVNNWAETIGTFVVDGNYASTANTLTVGSIIITVTK